MKQGTCHLCDKNTDLAKSHIIPKFVFRWMKNTGGKYFRSPLNPNRRIQDGEKNYLFCFDCEQKFSSYEKWFANNIFFQHLNNDQRFLNYDENLGNFIISILWRRLLISKINAENYYEDVFYDWKSYLDKNKPLKFNDIHMLFLGNKWGKQAQPNEFVHRYFNRAVDTNIAEIDGETFVFAKFARFLLFTKLKGETNNFRGTQVLFKKSRFPFVQYIDNGKFFLFFLDRAEKIYQLALSEISIKEQEKIVTEISNKPQEFWKSDAGKSVALDLDSNIAPFEIDNHMKYLCDCCLSSMEEPDGYLLRTFEVIQSAYYWGFAFQRNELGLDKDGLDRRIEYFKEISSSPTPWIICDKCISMFDIDRIESKSFMNRWISLKGNFEPSKCDDFRNYVDDAMMKRISEIIVTVNKN